MMLRNYVMPPLPVAPSSCEGGGPILLRNCLGSGPMMLRTGIPTYRGEMLIKCKTAP